MDTTDHEWLHNLSVSVTNNKWIKLFQTTKEDSSSETCSEKDNCSASSNLGLPPMKSSSDDECLGVVKITPKKGGLPNVEPQYKGDANTLVLTKD